MNKKKIVQVLIGLGALAMSGAVQGVDIPPWWHTRGLMNSNATANDYAPANVGQLKQVAYQTWVEVTNQAGGVERRMSKVEGQTNLWNMAHNWGSHATNGYVTGAVVRVESDPQVGANTVNYLSKWNGSALVSGTVYDNGNVGIGTASPATKLDVAGTVKASGGVQVGSPAELRPAAGTMRWNGRGFEGYDGSNWVSFTTGHINVWPMAQNDTATTLTNTAVTVSVLANDTGEGLSVASVTQPANGTVSNGGTNVVYTPAVNFAGTNLFNYVLGSWYGSVTGQVTVVVVNATPVVSSGLVLVQGGTLPDIGNGVVTVSSFAMGKYEVQWGEWQAVQMWAAANSYDIGSVGSGCADNHPVKDVSWYDVVKWCNARSEMEGRTPVYTVSGAVYRSGESNTVAINASATGYRLPTNAEWEFAARGGTLSHGYMYSGGNDLNTLGWYTDNSGGAACDLSGGRGTWPVGQKVANELGLYDMSGNLWEWCFDWHPSYVGSYRIFRGGGWSGVSGYCQANIQSFNAPSSGTTAASASGWLSL